jgi:site-specific recombinase XerD
MIASARTRTLRDYLHEYSLTREIKPETIRQYEISVDLFNRWRAARGLDPATLETLDELEVSAWLRDYSATVSPATVRAKKQAVLSLWRAAADDRLAADPVTRRVRRTSIPAQPVEAWTRHEIEQLLATAATLPRWHRCGLRRSVWFDLAIRVAWDSGLRWGDLITLPVAAVRPDGWTSITQSKTGKVSTFRLSASTMEALKKTLETVPRDLICPWPSSHETFTTQVRNLVKRAGIRPGTWKWIRRASGTDVELQAEGAGHLHLGNTRRIFEAHYADASQIARRPPSPRELAAAPQVDATPAGPAESRPECASTTPTT